MPACSNHPQSSAAWFCRKCGRHWCGECVQVVKGVCKSFAFCPRCRDFCEAAESEKSNG
ncbi:MAG: hypothetical protein NTV79_07355 [Candidatus Aureabacteria bacterium]|nr:hypothetical protein [Candidatus Auribacterota bacterium]